MCHYTMCTCVPELHWQVTTPLLSMVRKCGIRQQTIFVWVIFYSVLNEHIRFLASIKLKALFCPWNTENAFNGFMVITFSHFPKLDEWFIQKDRSFLFGGCTRLHATINLALKQIWRLRRAQLLPKANSTPMAKHNTAHSRGNMKDTNKSFNKLAITTGRGLEREEEKNKLNTLVPRRGKGKKGNEAEIVGMMNAMEHN